MSIKGYIATVIGAIFAAFIMVGTMASANAEPITPSAPVTTQAVICDPSDCDPDEGETLTREELAELYVPLATAPAAEPAESVTPAAAAAVETAPAVDRIEEDEPGWDCTTMGNKICEPVGAALPACFTDEAEPGVAPCYWDAAAQGNGQGHSFIWDGQTVTYTS